MKFKKYWEVTHDEKESNAGTAPCGASGRDDLDVLHVFWGNCLIVIKYSHGYTPREMIFPDGFIYSPDKFTGFCHFSDFCFFLQA